MNLKRATANKPAGLIQTYEPGGRLVEMDTCQCAHCGMHWMIVRGSGKQRGWCTRCGGPLCNENPMCMKMCYPAERRLDDLEKHGRLIIP